MDLETHETPNFTLARKNYTQILLFETSHSIINIILYIIIMKQLGVMEIRN